MPVVGGGSEPNIARGRVTGVASATGSPEYWAAGLTVSENLTAAEANRTYYAAIAETYNETEECVVEGRLRLRLRRALERALADLPPSPRVLDACGGSGNVSLLLLEAGVSPTTVDVSPEMLRIYEAAARARQAEPDMHVGEIDSFLRDGPQEWDLIVFSSALHHLDDYASVLRLAASRLAPGGMVLTMFDPLLVGRPGRVLRRLDYVLHVLLRTPGRVPATLGRKLRHGSRRAAPEHSVGASAERHALTGIDDRELDRLFREAGLDVIVHERRYEGRFGVTRLAYRALRQPSSFEFLVRRPAVGRSPGRGAEAAAQA